MSHEVSVTAGIRQSQLLLLSDAHEIASCSNCLPDGARAGCTRCRSGATARRAGAQWRRRARRSSRRCAQSAGRDARAGRCDRRHQHGRSGRRPVCLGHVGRGNRDADPLAELAGRIPRSAAARGARLSAQAGRAQFPRTLCAGFEGGGLRTAARPGAGTEARAGAAQRGAAGCGSPATSISCRSRFARSPRTWRPARRS